MNVLEIAKTLAMQEKEGSLTLISQQRERDSPHFLWRERWWKTREVIWERHLSPIQQEEYFARAQDIVLTLKVKQGNAE